MGARGLSNRQSREVPQFINQDELLHGILTSWWALWRKRTEIQIDIVAPEFVNVRLLGREEAGREDRVFWHSTTPSERLAAAERLRQIAYGYDVVAARIPAIVEFNELKRR